MALREELQTVYLRGQGTLMEELTDTANNNQKSGISP